jgi:hypothetical protein
MQVQQRQHLSHLRALAAPGRQDHRPEPPPLTSHRVDAAVVHPRCAHRDAPGHGPHRTLARVAVAHHQPPASLVALGRVGGQIVVDLGLQGGGEHPPGAFAGQPVQVHPQLALHSLISDYTQHRGVTLLTGVAAPVSHLGWSNRRVRRAHMQGAVHNFRSYLPGPCLFCEQLSEGYFSPTSLMSCRSSGSSQLAASQAFPVTNSSAWPFLKGPLSPTIVALQLVGVAGHGMRRNLLP